MKLDAKNADILFGTKNMSGRVYRTADLTRRIRASRPANGPRARAPLTALTTELLGQIPALKAKPDMVARITIDEDGARVPQETLIAGLKWIDDWTNVSIMAANPAAQATLKKIPVRTFGDLRRVIEYSLPVDKDHLPERWVLQPGGQEVKSIGNDEANTYSLNVKDLGVHLRLHESPKPNQANRYLVFRITRLLDAGRFWYLEIAAHIPEIRG